MAKAWFLITGTIVSLGLPTFFGWHEGQGAAAFGIYGVVINLVSIFNMVMISGTLQAVSKVVSETPDRSPEIVRRALRVQLGVGVPIGLAYVVAAPLTARALNDPNLVPYLRLSGGIILMYSFYAIFVGYFNGNKQFTRQATLDIAFATLKTALIIGAVLTGLGVMGAVGGFVATAVVLTIAAGTWVWRRERAAERPALPSGDRESREVGKRLLGYMIGIMAYTLALNFIIRVDLFVVKSMSAAGPVVPEGAVADGSLSDVLSGIYTAMANVARLPYQAVIAITFVIFPIISQATFKGDRTAARRYVRESLRYSLLLVSGMVAVLIADRDGLLNAIYPPEYAVGGPALLWLALGMLAFALMYVGTTILISAGRPVISLIIAAATVAAAVGLNVALLHGLEPGWLMLERAGIATFAATAAGAAATGGVLFAHFRATLPVLTVARVAAIAAGVILLAPYLPVDWALDALGGGRVISLAVIGVKMAFLFVLFYALLYGLGEFGQADRERLRSVLRKRSRRTR